MDRAALPPIAVRYAVSSLGLAALAVSATLVSQRGAALRPSPTVPDRPHREPRIGRLVVIGTPEYESVRMRVVEATSMLAACPAAADVITVYAHVSDHRVTDVSVPGPDPASCIAQAIRLLTFDVADEMDLMIPVYME